MYYAHFGLNEAPFRITPNTEVFFAGGNRGAILDALIYAISQGEGIIKVTGEVGTGKTMLCNMLQSRLPPHIETVYLAHPSVSPEEILHAIAFELQLKVARDANRMEVMQALYSYLLERHAQNKQVVIFIEESQNMPIATLEEVRLLSNLETGKHKLLQIVLFGQPELDENLRQPNIRQLRERITHSFALPPLAPQEVGEYLMFRMRAVGYRGPDLFSAVVVKRIAQASAGLTRRVNLIADKALLAAFSENTHTVEPKHVAAAVRDSEFARDTAVRSDARKRWMLASAAALVAALGAAFYWAVGPGFRLGTPGNAASETSTAGPTRERVPAGPTNSTTVPARADPSPTDRSEAVSGPRREQADVPVSTAPAAGPSMETQASGPVTATVAAIQASDSTPAAAIQASGPVTAPPETPALQNTVVASARQPLATIPVDTVATPPAAGNETAPVEVDVLASRIEATLAWIEQEDPRTHCIQLLGSENPQQLKEHLSSIGKSIEITKIYVYRTVARQKPFLSVLYGSFGSREAAQNALDRLPPSLKAFRPYVRTVQGIREELSRNKTL